MKKLICSAAIAISMFHSPAVASRWELADNGNAIKMNVVQSAKPHADHIEMSGKQMSVVLYWDIDSNGVFGLNRALVFPMLRTIPNDTHASLMLNNDIDLASMLRINNKRIMLTGRTVILDGYMSVVSDYNSAGSSSQGASLELTRTIFPTMEHPAMVELYTVRNTDNKPFTLLVPDVNQRYTTDPAKGVKGAYIIQTDVEGSGAFNLAPGQSHSFAMTIQAYPEKGGTPVTLDAARELATRKAFINTIDNNLILDTPDDVIDTEFRYAKIRGAESIYKTKGGYMHSPGGESYYAALWCNDQAEYINPFFPFLGYEVGNESALNCFRHYARFINDEYKPIPSSIIAEGDGIWNGAGDRGDAAMLAYGAARYALAHGDKAEADELWKLIEWCLEYNRRKVNQHGVVSSDHDELEGRFPAGDANLCTASLYYDALNSAVFLGKELKKNPKLLADYSKRAKKLRKAIESHFGATVQGYDTYRYYDGNDVLRSWICIPLVMGINDRGEATVKALLSPEMYTDDGVLTCQGNPIFWDRATLYTLRGALYAGYPDDVVPRLSDFSARRLLGDHVPYPIEAWPEGNQRHLSAESGLYCRVITEGLFGIRPTGLHSFDLKPELPSNWEFANLKHIRAFENDFDINVKRLPNGKLKVSVIQHNGPAKHFTIKPGETVKVKF